MPLRSSPIDTVENSAWRERLLRFRADSRSVRIEGDHRNLAYCHSPWKTEMGAAGGQLVKGCRGQAHREMRVIVADAGRDVPGVSRLPKENSSEDRSGMPRKT